MPKEMKLIMEGFRDWFSKEKREPREPLDISDEELPPALMVHVSEGEHELILYKPTVKYNTDPAKYDKPRVLGMMMLDKTNLDCIPNTMQVRFSAVPEQGKGYGSLMYGLAFHYVNNILGAGLTSDHDHGSSDDAKKIWDKLSNTKGLITKSTPKDHDAFDYSGKKTPDDKLDDCDDGSSGDVKDLATNHSWIMKDNKFKKSFDELNARNRDYVENTEDVSTFKASLINQSDKLFDDEYSGEE